VTPNHTEPNSPTSEGCHSTLSNLIDEVVTKFADDYEAPNLDDYFNKPDDKSSKDTKRLIGEPQVLPTQAKKTTVEENFQTTRWLLNQPPMFNVYTQGLGAENITGAQHHVFPPGYMCSSRGYNPGESMDQLPSFATQMQIMQMLHSKSSALKAPSTTASSIFHHNRGAPQSSSAVNDPSLQPMKLPLFIETSQPSASQVSSAIQTSSVPVAAVDSKPHIPACYSSVLPPDTNSQPGRTQGSSTAGTAAISAQGASTLTMSTSISTHAGPTEVMASKYPILSGFIKIAEEEEAKSLETSPMPVKFEPGTLDVASTKPEGSRSNLSSLIDEVVNKFADESTSSPEQSQPASWDESHFSNRVRQRLFHHIKRRSSQNLLSSGESPMPSPEPCSPSQTPASTNQTPFIYPQSTLAHQGLPPGMMTHRQLPIGASQGTTPNSIFPFVPSSSAPVMAQVLAQPAQKTVSSIPALPIFTTGLGNESNGAPVQVNVSPQRGATALQSFERQVQQMQGNIPVHSEDKAAISEDNKLPVLPKPEELMMNLRQSLPTVSVGCIQEREFAPKQSQFGRLPVTAVPVSVAAQPISAATRPTFIATEPQVSPQTLPMSTVTQSVPRLTHSVSRVTQAVPMFESAALYPPLAPTQPATAAVQSVPTAGNHVSAGAHPILAAALVRAQPPFVPQPMQSNSGSESTAQPTVYTTESEHGPYELSGTSVSAGIAALGRASLTPENRVNVNQSLAIMFDKGRVESVSTSAINVLESNILHGIDTTRPAFRSVSLSDSVLPSSHTGSSKASKDNTGEQPCRLIQLAEYVISDEIKEGNQCVTGGKPVSSPDSASISSLSHTSQSDKDFVDRNKSVENWRYNEFQSEFVHSDPRVHLPKTGPNREILYLSNHSKCSTVQKDPTVNSGSEMEKPSVLDRAKSGHGSSGLEATGQRLPWDIDESSKSSTGSEESKSKKVEVSSVPGWFGKGLKKYKKKR
jgi:hypothetical protein